MNLYPAFKKIAFSLDPEFIHEKSLNLLHQFPSIGQLFSHEVDPIKYSVELKGLKWSFPIGLAAGLDKNAIALNFFDQLPFGAIEVGTITPEPQEGNEKPRLFRYPESKSLRNRMGFNNFGSREVLVNVINYTGNKVIGVNIGKNKVTPNDLAIYDYLNLYKKFYHHADYLVVNISSPNTPDLRALQSESFLKELGAEFNKLKSIGGPPVFIKLDPDMEREQVAGVIEASQVAGFDGVIATNTTVIADMGSGGVSGGLLKHKARDARKLILSMVSDDFPLIGVGGVDSFDDLWDFWSDGGKLMQVYSAFIYQGPKLLIDMKNSIDQILAKYQLKDVEEITSNINHLNKDINN